jgi:uncharacterized protein YraI
VESRLWPVISQKFFLESCGKEGFVQYQLVLRLFWGLLISLFLAGCRQENPPVVAVVEPTVTRLPATATPKPAATVTAVSSTSTPQPTASSTATPSRTVRPTATAKPIVRIQVVDEVTGEAVAGATVRLAHFTALTDGQGYVTFDSAPALAQPYSIQVAAPGFHALRTHLLVDQTVHELILSLQPGVFAEVMAAGTTLRTGPGPVYTAAGQVDAGMVLLVVGRSQNGAWLLVEPANGQVAWLEATAVTIQGKIDQVVAIAAPPTPTPAPTVVTIVVPPPPTSPHPSGPNLLVNPGFEDALNGWTTYRIADLGPFYNLLPTTFHSGHFVRTGAWALGRPAFQDIAGLTPGTTYRFGAWVKIWSSSEDDPTVSVNPAEIDAYVCLNPTGNEGRWQPTTVCSPYVRPFDRWHFISVDAVATNEPMTVILYLNYPRNRPKNNVIVFDDAYLGLAPVSATPTPAPLGPPARPQPIAFNPPAVRDSMKRLQTSLEHLGGLLDRLYQGTGATCTEIESLYRQVVQAPTYHSLPVEWQAVYNDYAWAADNGTSTNETIYSLCVNRYGPLTLLNYTVARTGINDSLSRLIPAIQVAESLAGP